MARVDSKSPIRIPEWVKFLMSIGAVIVALSMAFADLKADLRVEIAERLASDVYISKQLEEIKQMMREEYQRHHDPGFVLPPK